MEDLKYIIEDSAIIELLGIQSFTNKESAILELVKNSFDARATELSIKITPLSIVITDNGIGMDKQAFLSNWLYVGKSNKTYQIVDCNGKKRVLAGSKGIGRFALARLGQTIKLQSLKNGATAIVWETNWEKNYLNEDESFKQPGSTFTISKLRDKWTKSEAEKLASYLGRVYNDTVMIIKLYYEDTEIFISKLFENPRIGQNYVSDIILKYSCKEKKLQINIDSDEFLPEAKKYCKEIDLNRYLKTVDMLLELKNLIEYQDKDLNELLDNIGDFSGRFFFSINRSLRGDEEKFLYKYIFLKERYESGIILYRNSFSISSYEGSKDWLCLSQRARKSPAAATHPTGTWRVRENQLSGFVRIDKEKNKKLQDLANRQGLDENDYYKLLIDIIHVGISCFERYRQSIIRSIDKKNKEKEEACFKKANIINSLLKNPQKLLTLSDEEKQELLNEIKQNEEEKKEYQQQNKRNEERYRYDVRLLNVLASSGLRATSIAHDLRNDRNILSDNYDFIVTALKEYDLWDILNSPEHTKLLYKNVPEMLKKNKDVGSKIIVFMDTMLEEIEKRQFVAAFYNISELMEKVIKRWKNDYSWIEIQLDIDKNLKYWIPEDIINVIFDNLILNTVQQNDSLNSIEIAISILKQENSLYISYKDKGVGLDKKYLNDPRRILAPHETTRPNGHGLGMWIVNNTIDMTGGIISEIQGKNGFSIRFTIGNKL